MSLLHWCAASRAGGTFHIEDVQDQVELALMRSGEQDVARSYVLYRAKRMEERRTGQGSRPAATPTGCAADQRDLINGGQRLPLDDGGACTRPDQLPPAPAWKSTSMPKQIFAEPP